MALGLGLSIGITFQAVDEMRMRVACISDVAYRGRSGLKVAPRVLQHWQWRDTVNTELWVQRRTPPARVQGSSGIPARHIPGMRHEPSLREWGRGGRKSNVSYKMMNSTARVGDTSRPRDPNLRRATGEGTSASSWESSTGRGSTPKKKNEHTGRARTQQPTHTPRSQRRTASSSHCLAVGKPARASRWHRSRRPCLTRNCRCVKRLLRSSNPAGVSMTDCTPDTHQ